MRPSSIKHPVVLLATVMVCGTTLLAPENGATRTVARPVRAEAAAGAAAAPRSAGNVLTSAAPRYLWDHAARSAPLSSRIVPPPGFLRLSVPPGSFGAWLRELPLRDGSPEVRLYDGRLKGNQTAHHAVLDIDVGDKDLQQCADAIIRLRAEYLRSRGCEEAIEFHFTSGEPVAWTRWRGGERPHVRDNRVTWSATAAPDPTYANFRRYLESVFTYAGTVSLQRELRPAHDPSQVEPGDVFIEGGFPGHAVLVVDVAIDRLGERVFLLAQSFMPAQDIHILRAPASPFSPWYRAARAGPLLTPQWLSRHETLRRFPPPACSDDSEIPTRTAWVGSTR